MSSLVVLLLLLLCGLLVGVRSLAGAGEPGSGVVVAFPDSAGQLLEDTVLGRNERSADANDEDYGEDDVGPEGRHFKRKFKRKFKPHKYGQGYGGYGCRTLHGCGGFGGWQQPHFGGYGGGPIAAAFAGPNHGYGGWNPGYGGWNPGYGGGYGRPRPHSQVASWNFGPFQGAFGFAQAG